LTIPTPLMLVGASVFMSMTPYPMPKTPFNDKPEPNVWWSREVESPVEPPIEPPRKDTLAHVERELKCPRCGSKEIGREMHPGSFGIRARFVYSCRKCGNQWER
jgi:DNA-directed RNA polymerase subunit RPC12/RpoP